MAQTIASAALAPGESLSAAAPSSWLPFSLLLLGSLLWGLIWWPLKYFNQQGLSGVSFALVVYGGIALLLLPMLWIEWETWRGRRHFWWGLFLFGGYGNLAFTNALIYGDPVRMMMLFYLAPVWSVLGGRLWLGERITSRRALGVGLALLGAFLVLGGPRLGTAPPTWLDLLALSAGMTFALTNITFRATHSEPLLGKICLLFLGSTLFAGCLTWFLPHALPALPPAAWAWLALFAVCWLLAATLLTQYSVTHLEAGRSGVLLLTELVVVVVSATLIGGKVLSFGEISGGVAILTAAAIEAQSPPPEA